MYSAYPLPSPSPLALLLETRLCRSIRKSDVFVGNIYQPVDPLNYDAKDARNLPISTYYYKNN